MSTERMYQGKALNRADALRLLSARAYARFLMLSVLDNERAAMAEWVQAKLMGNPERIDLAYRSWLAWEQRLDDAVDKCYLADRIAKLTQR